jgi:hypothetical protein
MTVIMQTLRVAGKIIGFIGFQYNFVIFNSKSHKAFGSSKVAGDGLLVVCGYSDFHLSIILMQI